MQLVRWSRRSCRIRRTSSPLARIATSSALSSSPKPLGQAEKAPRVNVRKFWPARSSSGSVAAPHAAFCYPPRPAMGRQLETAHCPPASTMLASTAVRRSKAAASDPRDCFPSWARSVEAAEIARKTSLMGGVEARSSASSRAVRQRLRGFRVKRPFANRILVAVRGQSWRKGFGGASSLPRKIVAMVKAFGQVRVRPSSAGPIAEQLKKQAPSRHRGSCRARTRLLPIPRVRRPPSPGVPPLHPASQARSGQRANGLGGWQRGRVSGAELPTRSTRPFRKHAMSALHAAAPAGSPVASRSRQQGGDLLQDHDRRPTATGPRRLVGSRAARSGPAVRQNRRVLSVRLQRAPSKNRARRVSH